MKGVMACAYDDPNLGDGPFEDSDILVDDSDSGSLLSDDSVLPIYEREEKYTEPPKTLYEACRRNDALSLRTILERGVTKEEAMELDTNGRVRLYFFICKLKCTVLSNCNYVFHVPQNGLMMAVSKGFVDIISTLHVCPFIDINHQDNDGNTALMIAAQAGMCIYIESVFI